MKAICRQQSLIISIGFFSVLVVGGGSEVEGGGYRDKGGDRV